MPEYLAPGVYVEETSFRAKSIEGVGTSTTAFVGPTRKGPVGTTPELLTSFGDFERVYGGFDDLNLDPNHPDRNINYLAHAVRAYFDNGGSRLYVSRVVGGADPDQPELFVAHSDDLLLGDPVVQFMARFPGEGGNGEVLLFQKSTPASQDTLSSAPLGSIVRVGSGGEGTPARIEGGELPFALEDGSSLVLVLGVNNVDTEHTITFRGRSAEAISADALPAQITVPADTTLTVQVGQDGVEQRILLPEGTDIPRADLVAAINRRLRGGYARLTTAAEGGPADRLAIGTDVRGRAAFIQVRQLDLLEFTAEATTADNSSALATTNNVNDLGRVTLDDIRPLLPAGIEARVVDQNLVLLTTQTGEGVTLQVRDPGEPPPPLYAAMGLTDFNEVSGEGSLPPRYFLKIKEDQRPDDWVPKVGAALAPADFTDTQVDLLSLTVVARDRDGNEVNYDDLGFAPTHPRWIGSVFTQTPSRPSDALTNPFLLKIENLDLSSAGGPLDLRTGLLAAGSPIPSAGEGPLELAVRIRLSSGQSGLEPTAEDYGRALKVLESLEDISIVAAPGHTAYSEWQAIQDRLITHVSRRRAYQIAVLDTPKGQSLNTARQVRSRIDSSYAALYYPWVVVANPLARPGSLTIPREIALPPSGFVCGIYARNDIERGVYKAPANEVVRGALRLEQDINFAQQEVLNPLGINCLRFFPGRGYRVWGARTASSDPEWKYVNVRRYFNYLEASIERGSQWAVFEPNGDRLWNNVRETISAFLYNEWVSGALLGGTPQEAYFVRCDRSTMTQNDLDNGRLICLIGVAVIKPAEFVIFRIGQKTADARS